LERLSRDGEHVGRIHRKKSAFCMHVGEFPGLLKPGLRLDRLTRRVEDAPSLQKIANGWHHQFWTQLALHPVKGGVRLCKVSLKSLSTCNLRKELQMIGVV